MTTEDLVMVIDKPHFIVKLHKTLLQVDLKKGAKKELEDFLEAKPILRESLGFLFQTIVPLDVALKHIESARVDDNGQVRMVIPHRKDIVIPLNRNESERLVEKMSELIAEEKEKVVLGLLESEKARKKLGPKIAEAEAEAQREEIHRL